MTEFLPGKKNRKQATAPKPEHEELLRILLDRLSDYAIILLDAEGRIITWSLGGERIKLFRAEDVVGKHFSLFYPPEDIRQGKPQRLLEEAATQGRTEDEGWRLRRDGTRFWARVVITALRDKSGMLKGFGSVVSDETKRKGAQGALQNLTKKLDQRVQERTSQLNQVNRELRDSLAQLRALAARLQAVREEERTSIAREIHDDLGQTLTAMNMDLVWLGQRLPGAERSLQLKFNSILKLVDTAIFSVRRIASALRPGLLDDLGLSAAIEWQAQDFQSRTGIECKLVLPGDDVLLDDESTTAVFRIFQETLTNVARHAAATRVVVRLITVGQELILEVVDNGKGFENVAGTTERSLGLLGMKERALILGGKFEICSSPGQGTSVTVRVPLTHRSKGGATRDKNSDR